jgi:alcohol dehydrogenase YqhD (iron-dependent ADH family)
MARTAGVDFVLAVGGGSVIDTAKAICLGIPYEGDFWDFFIGKAVPVAGVPVATVLTIPAAGSEGSGNAVITREETMQKLGAKGSIFMRPKFSIMNPELTFTLPEWQTASGITDMIAHLLERYLSNSTDVMIGDRLCEGVLKAIIETAPRVMSDPEDYGARANIMWSGMVAHNDTCSAGRVEEWSTHAMEHELSALYDVTHGAGLAVMFPAYLTFMAEHNPHKVAQLAMRVFDVKASAENATELPLDEQKAVALQGANLLRSFFKETLHMPVTISELGISSPDFDTLVRKLHENKGEKLGTYYPLTPDVTRKIYEIANA